MPFVLRKAAISWLGHSSFRISVEGSVVLYVDPYCLPDDSAAADIILVTHEHYDHFDIASIRKIAKDGTVIVMPEHCSSSHDFSQAKSIAKVHLIPQDSEIRVGSVGIRSVPAYNIGKPYHPKGKGVGYVVSIGGINAYHAGDTDVIPEMSRLADAGIDVAFLPIGGKYTMDEAEAAEAAKAIRPRIAVPMHYGKITGGDPQKFQSLVGSVCKVEIF